MDIAIIGSEMAGLVAAKILKDAGHTVTIFDTLSTRDLDSQRIQFEGETVDVPLRIMNPHLWKNTISLATHLGITMFPVRTQMACSWLFEDRIETWLTTTRSRIGNFPVINNRKGIKQYGWRLVKGMLQLKKAIHHFFKSKQQDITLAEFINQNDIEEVFWHGVVMPVLYTICTCNPKTIGEWPAKPLLTFLRHLTDGDTLLRMQGGVGTFIDHLLIDMPIEKNVTVTAVEEQADKVRVTTAQGNHAVFDRIIVATPPDQLDTFLPAEQFVPDITLLKEFRFEESNLVIHTDSRVMPPQRKDWAALSYMMDRKFTRQQFTVWMNAVEPGLVGKNPVFQTWQPVTEIDPKKIIATVKLTRPVVDSKTIALNQSLQQRQKDPERKVFYCGSWSCEGLPMLESSILSAIQIAQIFKAPLAFTHLKPHIEIAPQLGN